MKRRNVVLDAVFIGFGFHMLYFYPSPFMLVPLFMMILWFFPAYNYYKWTYKQEFLEEKK